MKLVNMKPALSTVFAVVCLATIGLTWADDTEYAPVVQLNSGKVRGLVLEVNSQKVNFYQGIRYGQARRFEKPTEVKPWTGVYNATTTRDSCPQPLADPATQLIQGESHSEDCLFLNIWQPADNKTGRPVMVWIHGGAFTIGTIFSISVDAKDIAQEGDVIVVAINYRLGPLGFLSDGGNVANLGLQDQILALRYIKENIHAFGGDPKLITIAGESAGSMSIAAIILSPLSHSLFKRAIMQSGALNSAIVHSNVALKKTQSFARKLNCFHENVTLIVKCLQGKALADIINATSFSLSNDNFQPTFGSNEVLPISPVEALKSGKFNRDIDLLYGVVNNEGVYFTRNIFPKYLTNATITLESATADIVHVMQLFNQSFGHEVAQLYLGHLPKNASQNALKSAVADAIGDHRIVCPTILFAEHIQKYASSAHFYSFRLMQHFNFPGFPTTTWSGVPDVAHAEDLPFLFLVPFLSTPEDQQLSKTMLKAWSMFARSGQLGDISGHQWTQSLSGSNPTTSFMALKANQYKMIDGFYKKTCEAFWKPKLFA